MFTYLHLIGMEPGWNMLAVGVLFYAVLVACIDWLDEG